MQPLQAPSKAQEKRIIEAARRVLKIESDAVAALIDRIDQNFVAVVNLLDACTSHIVVTGMGKSGLVGNKIAATFSSIGLPAVFLHAAEASHGDLGIIARGDIVLILSNSGETEELLKLLPTFNRLKCTLIAMTGHPDSTLGRRAQYVLDVSVSEEACALNIVPTASTTAAIAMGDTLALALLEKRGFKPEDFAQYHPGGSLGRKLLTTIGDLMHTGEDVPRVTESADIYSLLTEMSVKRMGTTIVVDAKNCIRGIITDGDLRRLMESKKDFSTVTAKDLMHADPRTIRQDDMATKALQMMEEFSITSVIVSDDGKRIEGIIHLHDLLKAGIA